MRPQLPADLNPFTQMEKPFQVSSLCPQVVTVSPEPEYSILSRKGFKTRRVLAGRVGSPSSVYSMPNNN